MPGSARMDRCCYAWKTAQPGLSTPALVLRCGDITWTEAELTRINSPDFSTAVEAQFEVSGTQSSWYEVDLTDLIKITISPSGLVKSIDYEASLVPA